MIFDHLKIGTKLIISMVLLVTIVIIALSTIIGYQVRKMAEYDAKVIAEESAYRYANIVEIELEVALNEARALADVFESKIVENFDLDRDKANRILKHFIEINDNFLGIFLALEPNVYDGNDANFMNMPGYDKTGRFISYWYRDSYGQGQVKTIEPSELEEPDNLYQLPKKLAKETIIEPHIHAIQGKDILTTSLVAPIFDKQNNFAGVLGIDLALEELQKLIRNVKIPHFNTAYATFYSAKGIIITSKDSSYTGKHIEEITNNPALIKNVLSNKSFYLKRLSKSLGTAVMTYGAPVKIGYTNLYWMVAVSIPEAELEAESKQIILLIITIGLIILLLAILVIYLLSITISKKLTNLVKISSSIATGNLNNEISSTGKDELGQLSRAFESMQTQLRQRMEEDKQIADEALRINEALNKVTRSVLIADTYDNIIYANESAIQLFQQAESAIREELSNFKVENLLGTSIALFYKKSKFDWHGISRNQSSTHCTLLTLGHFKFEISITPVINVAGQYLGTVTEFRDRTVEMATEQEINAVMLAASQGDFHQRISLVNKEGFFKTFSEILNQTLDYNQQMIEELRRVFAAIARGDLSQTVTKEYAGSLEQLKNDVNATIAKLTRVMNAIQQTAEAASQGDFSRRIELEDEDQEGFFKILSQLLNQILDSNQKIIEELMRVFAALASGDLTQTITQYYVGLLEQLKEDINTTVTILTQVVNTVKQTWETINIAADEISQGNTHLSQRTEEQASSLQQTATSMEEMTSIVQQNTDNARQATHLAMNARERARQGGEIVGAAVAAMSEINKSSKKVSDIIGVIDDIAFQTNLLALNAAVEAARAGEQGRGFAVVATEVRSLAQRSAAAAKEIKNLIQDSLSKVEEGTQLVNQSGATLEEIVVAVNKASEMVVEIAAAGEEQAAGIQQVNKAILQLDEITQQNAALVEEAAVASDSMKEQVQSLREQVTFFKTDHLSDQATFQQPNTMKKPLQTKNRDNLAKNILEPSIKLDKEWQDF